MKISIVTEKEFLKFKYKLYRNDKFFCDSTFFNLKSIFEKKCDFTQNLQYIAIAVKENNEVLCEGLLIDAYETTLHLGYFDAKENVPLAVNILNEYALSEAKARGKERLIVGINGHVSYGVGVLLNGAKKAVSFDSLYNYKYYEQYFSAFKKTTLSTYEISLNSLMRNFEKPLTICRGLTVRPIDMRNFDSEMRDFSVLCNETLADTDYYEPVGRAHMGQLLSGLKPFLKGENILFCERNGEKIGFLLWHPDFNVLFNKGCKTSIFKVALNFLLRKNTIKSVKINAVGVKKGVGREFAFYLLMQKMYSLIAGKVKSVETTFVMDSNLQSKNALINSGFRKQNDYAVFKWSVYEKGSFESL